MTRKKDYRRSARGRGDAGAPEGPLVLYGLHTVAAALANPKRRIIALRATENALARLAEMADLGTVAVETVSARDLSRALAEDAVHQGVALEVEPLEPLALDGLEGARLVVALDQVTDPHNVGAIMRTAVAFGADAVMTTWRHSPRESAVLAKAASGAVDLIEHVQVGNLARGLTALRETGFQVIGLDSAGATPLADVPATDSIVLVLGAEGKGLRQGVRDSCDAVARLDLPGPIKSLNVSNAAAVAFYAISRAAKR